MKHKPGAIIAVLLALPILYLASCRKDNSGPTPAPEVSSFLPGKEGSYWVYGSYYVDSNESGYPGGFDGRQPAFIDSMYIAADTMIRGQTFHCLMRPDDIGIEVSPWYFRDSANYLVGPSGQILFAVSDSNRAFTSETHSAEFFNGDSLMLMQQYVGRGRVKQTPAGSFYTSAFVTDWTFYPFSRSGQAVHHYRTYMRFATGVGIISESSPHLSSHPMQVERRLLRYHIATE